MFSNPGCPVTDNSPSHPTRQRPLRDLRAGCELPAPQIGCSRPPPSADHSTGPGSRVTPLLAAMFWGRGSGFPDNHREELGLSRWQQKLVHKSGLSCCRHPGTVVICGLSTMRAALPCDSVSHQQNGACLLSSPGGNLNHELF